jgi:hypothetical protein
LGLKPSEFWSLTLVEYNELVDAFVYEQKRKFEETHHLLAWHAANVMNASGNLKKPVTVEKLIGGNKENRPTKQGRVMSREEQRRKLDELKKKFGR